MPTELSILNRGREKALFPSTNRLGVQYFSDTFHYRDADLQTWLPQLGELGISWLVLEANPKRAIPEAFITGLVHANIRPLLHFRLSPENLPSEADLQVLLNVYSRWGVREAIFFDRPNDRSMWSPSAWAQPDLVERFLDRFIPIATEAHQNGITPIFPALEPGGSYWDTVFLRSALQSLMRRKQEKLAMAMGLAAYAWTHGKSLDWGLGGPISWPETRPYFTPSGSEDQIGFRIYDWYQEIARSVLRTSMPIYLLQAGSQAPTLINNADGEDQVEDYLTIAKLLNRTESDEVKHTINAHISPEVVCGIVGSLAEESGKAKQTAAWFDAAANPTSQVELFTAWRNRSKSDASPANRIKHYLLLPSYEWGIDEVQLDAIRPFLRKYKPAVGFSTDEAVLADSVTVIGDETVYPDETLNRLRQAGCKVERINGDGTTIASLLSER